MTNCARRFLLALSLLLVASAPLLGEDFGRLPLRFEANRGQTVPEVRFLSRGRGHTLFLAGEEIVLVPAGMPAAAVRMRLLGADMATAVTGVERLPGESHYLIGNDPGGWTTHVPGYARVRYAGVYPGIDLVFHGDRDILEFDFEVAAGADPKAIRMAFKGMDRLALDEAGSLVLSTAAGDVVLRPPLIFQEMGGERLPVAGRYVLGRRGRVGFEVGEYDRGRPLVIDPAILYSTYLGGSDYDIAKGIAVDSEGSAYVTGQTNSTDFPTSNARQPVYGGGTNDVFVVKLDRTGALVYSTYLGGISLDRGSAIEADAAGSAWVAGATYSDDFPVVNSLQPFRDGDAFVARLTPDGSSLVFSTFLGGTGDDEDALDIALDGQGSAYVAGQTDSTDFPRVGPYQATYGGGSHDAFVTRMHAAGSPLLFSTYLGGAGDDVANGVSLDASANVYVVGRTTSANFPLANPFQPSLNGSQDAFLTRLVPAGNSLGFSTYLGGGSFESANGIAVDPGGSAVVVGETGSDNFPVVSPVDPVRGPNNEGFVTRFNAAGSALLFSTFLGGASVDRAQGVKLDGSGNVLVTGDTGSTDFPVVSPLQAAKLGFSDVFVTVLNPAGTGMLFSTYLGGSGDENCCADIAVNESGEAYVTGGTTSADFPVVDPVQAGNAGSSDVFVTRMAVGFPSNFATPVITVGEDRLQWTPVLNATGYDVVRGDVGTLLGTRGDFTVATDRCLANDYAPTALPYTDVPPRGRASWFLVRWVTPSQVGTYDLDGAGQVGLRDAENEASPFACPPVIRPHPPIVINGDADFTAANGVIRGTGTQQDPYLIAYWDIAGAASGAGISITGTSAWFVIRGVKVHGGQYGVHLSSVANGRIERITATSNTHGIRIVSGGDIAVADNILSFNTQGSGLDVLGAARVLVQDNTLAGNMVGINLDGSTSTLAHHNNLLNNTLQAVDQRGGPNAWDDGYPSGGNYWTNYQGVDQCGGPNQDQCTAPDGLGDTPYPIGPESSRDRYPLMILPGSGSDTIPPGVAITSPADGAVFTTVPIVVQGGAADSGSGIRRTEVRLNGGAWVVATGVSSWSLSVVLAPGPNLIEARSFDHAGNISPIASVSVTYQTALLESVVQTNKGTYAPGEQVHIDLLLTNRGTGPVTLHFPSGCEAFFSVANGAGTDIYDLRQHIGCPDVLTERTIQPNETVTYNFDWNQIDDSGAPVPFPADYRIRGFFDSDEPVPDAFTTITIAQQPLLETAIETNRGSYSPGEPVQILLFLTNRGAAPVTLHFPSGCEAFFSVVNDMGIVLYDFRQHVGCPAIVTQRTIQPNETVTYFFDWNQVDDSGAPVPTPASYTIRGFFASAEPVPDAFTFITVGPQLSPLVTVVQTNKTRYAPGERVFITLRITNQGTSTVTLNFPTSCQAFFAVMDSSDSVVYDDLQHAICFFVFTQRILQPGQTATYSFDWFQTNDAGQQVTFPANYRIRGYLDSAESVPDAFRTIAVGP